MSDEEKNQEEPEDDFDLDLFGDEDEIDLEAIEREVDDDRADEGQYTDRNGDVHVVESYPKGDGTVAVVCTLCGWEVVAEGWSGEDENGNKIGAKAEAFVPALRNAHLLKWEQWPYKRYKPNPEGWPDQPPIEDGDS